MNDDFDLLNVVRPALLLRKPLEHGLTIAQNVLKHGTGALNIDGCRFGYGDSCWVGPQEKHKGYPNGIGGNAWSIGQPPDQTRTDPHFLSDLGRWPANLYQCKPDNTQTQGENMDNIDRQQIRSLGEYTKQELDDWADMPDAKVLHGDCMALLKTLPDNSIDAIVTDPPYGMSADGIARTWADLDENSNKKGFMGKSWDAAVPCHNFFAECLRVLKHGGHMIAFSSTRTVCALGMAAQKGGFRIRDMIHWCYFSGFPKSHDISKAIDREAGAVREVIGQKTARMMTKGSPFSSEKQRDEGYRPNWISEKETLTNAKRQTVSITKPATQDAQKWEGFGTALKPAVEPALLLRKPLEHGLTIAQNVLKHGTGALNIDGCRFGYGDPCWVGPQDRTGFRSVAGFQDSYVGGKIKNNVGFSENEKGRWPANLYQCAKASRSEREAGLDHLETKSGAEVVDRKEGSAGLGNPRAGAGRTADEVRNIHPTVKPIKLMRWCCRLVGGQKGSVILDPFAGSGTTLAAALLEGFNSVGMEMTDQYLPIIQGRINWAKSQYKIENAQLKLLDGL